MRSADSGTKPSMRRRALIMLLFSQGASNQENEPVDGITRLQKLLFLMAQDPELRKYLKSRYEFAAYKYGPFAEVLYDDVQYLDSFGLLETTEFIPNNIDRVEGKAVIPAFLKGPAGSVNRPAAPARYATDVEIADLVNPDDLYSGDIVLRSLESDEFDPRQEFETRTYKLSTYGLNHARQIYKELGETNRKILNRISDIKSEYNLMNLRALLRAVYTKHPEFTSESTIVDELFG